MSDITAMQLAAQRLVASIAEEAASLRNENARLKAALKSVHADRCCNPSCTNPNCVALRALIATTEGR